MLSPFLLAIVADVTNEMAREDVLSEFLHDGLVSMSEAIEEFRNKIRKLKKDFESKG